MSKTLDTRAYFDRVMEEWRPALKQVDHPYADNPVWQQHHTALKEWVSDLGLADGRVLEIGAGTGLLQDIVPNYVGVDIAETSADYMQKPFGVASAIDLPFADNTFDGVFSVWVLEHIEHPEAMLSEMRRIVRPDGSVFICAAYSVDSWVSQGLHVRPFRALSWRQRLTKLSIPIRASIPYKVIIGLLRRSFHLLTYLCGGRQPTALVYSKLEPNYDTYWDYDADASVSLDAYSVVLYFLSRGDEPYYAAGVVRSLFQRSQPQAYIVRK